MPSLVRPLAVAVSLLLPAMGWADANPKFARLREAAEPLASLDTFLTRYIGECTGLLAGKDCRDSAAAFRKATAGKRYYMIIDEAHATMISSGPYDPGKGIYTVNILPFFTAGRYALSHGSPRRQDQHGNPIINQITVRDRTPVGWNAVRIQSLFARRQLRVQAIFVPVGIWSLPRRDGGRMYGVRANVEAILVTVGRSGEQIALWLNE